MSKDKFFIILDQLYKEYWYIFPNKSNLEKILYQILKSDWDDELKAVFLEEPWRLIYRRKPPNPQSFLTKEWLGEGSRIFEHLNKPFEDLFDPRNHYFRMYASMHIGWGKSVFVALAALYVITHLCLMHNPKEFFNVDKSSVFGIYFGSFTNDKAKQTLFTYMKNFMKDNPNFVFCKFKDRMRKVQEENPDKIVWSGPKDGYDLSFFDDVHVVIASEYENLLGLNLIFCAVTEISFFLETGADPEYIKSFIEGLEGRMVSRFGYNQPLAKLIFDTSPYSMSSPIDSYVFSGEAQKNPQNLVITGSHWGTYKDRYPEFETDYFYFYKGSPYDSPRIVKEEKELTKYEEKDLVKCPATLINMADDNPKKFLRDYVGFPTWDSPGIFTKELVNSCVSFNVPYIKTFLNSAEKYKQTLLEQFKASLNRETELFPAGNKHRYFCHLDLSKNMDTTGFAVGHKTYLKENREIFIFVIDLAIPIATFGSEIPYSQVQELISYLKDRSNGNLLYASLDSYGGPYFAQALEEMNFIVKFPFSVDTSVDHYLFLASMMNERRVVFGPNALLLGNFDSLIYKTTTKGYKIDHLTGKLGIDPSFANLKGEFTSIQDARSFAHLGRNAKDVTDAVAALVSRMALENHALDLRYSWSWEESGDSSFSLGQLLNNNNLELR